MSDSTGFESCHGIIDDITFSDGMIITDLDTDVDEPVEKNVFNQPQSIANDDKEKEEEKADLSILDQNTSFLSSLNDDELIEFINHLSQQKSKQHVQVHESTESISDPSKDSNIPLDGEKEELISSDGIASISSPNDEENISLQLAQPQSPLKIQQDIDELVHSSPESSSSRHGSQNVVFGDYATYFENKSKKQQLMDEEFLEWERKRLSETKSTEKPTEPTTSSIFKDLIFHVNGHTNPNIHTLHKLIILNGGKFIHHLSSKGQVTHIIAERLTPRKLNEFKNCKVVKPAWVLECLKVGKLIDWIEYSVIGLGYGQGRLGFKKMEKEELEAEEMEEEPQAVGETIKEKGAVDIDTNVDDDSIEKKPQEDSFIEDEEVDDSKDINIKIDSKHPDFLKTFFQKSRLHHLSSWKSDLRYEFLQKLQTNHQPAISLKFKNSANFKIIIHIDFDSFFAKVSSLSHHTLDYDTQPICVTHASNNFKSSTADVSSCNYVARSHGVKNGMWVKTAIELCPGLICLGYDFAGYERVSRSFYDILIELGSDSVYPVSIDEALLDVSSLFDEKSETLNHDVEKFCWDLKKLVLKNTKCVVSLGVSRNVLLAKLALRKAKPDGVFVKIDKDIKWIDDFDVVQLPGIGRSIEFKLFQFLIEKGHIDKSRSNERLKICDLKPLSVLELKTLLGSKNGLKLYQYLHGEDPTSIVITSNDFIKKSISIEINWGIRFDTIEQIDDFLIQVCQELCIKLNKFNLMTEQITLKVMKRAKGAPVEPSKYLGCGLCDISSKLTNLAVPCDDYRKLGNEARELYRYIGCEPRELRGVGIGLAKLVDKSKVGKQRKLDFEKVADIRKRLENQVDEFERVRNVNKKGEQKEADNLANVEEEAEINHSLTQFEIPSEIDSSVLKELPSSITEKIQLQRVKNSTSIEPVPSQIDMKILEQLPEEIQSELKAELKRRDLTNLRTSNSPSKKSNVYLQQIFPRDGTSPQKYMRVLKRSPSKRNSPSPNKTARKPEINKTPTRQRIRNPETINTNLVLNELDEETLKELPSSIREDVIKEYQGYKTILDRQKPHESKRRIDDESNNDKVKKVLKFNSAVPLESIYFRLFDSEVSNDGIVFQQKTDVDKIIELIRRWMHHTMKNGPNIRDVVMFKNYLTSLDDAEAVNLGKRRYLKRLILQELERFVLIESKDGDFSRKWTDVVEKLKGK